jgi:outer membrane receptor protein involved in Fe transport
LLLSATITFGQAVRPADDNTDAKKDDVVALEKYEVTGSRIKRLDTETVSPVVVMTAESLEAKGFQTFGDAIRSLSFNSGQALTPIDAGTSFTPGISTFNLRGLGNNSSLVLINGRRAAAYGAPGFTGLDSMFDLNSIPDAAVESFELLKDGGSAIYGSDAVAGVLNIKLRKDYQGAEASIAYGDFFNTSGAVKYASVTTGARSGKASVLVSAHWRDQGAIMARDLYYTRDADNTAVAHKANPRYAITGSGPLQDVLDAYGLTDPVSDEMFDNRSGTGIPGYVTIPSGFLDQNDPDNTLYAGSTYTSPEATNNPTAAGLVEGRHYYNYQRDTSLTDERRSYAFYTRGQYDINRYLSAAVELSLVHNESRIDSAPSPAIISTERGLDPTVPMYIPRENPYNFWSGLVIYNEVDDPNNPGNTMTETVFDGNVTLGARRLVEVGNRINDVTVDSPRLLFSLNGTFPESTFLKDWAWEAGVLHSRSEVTNLNRGTVPDYRLQQALMGLVSDGKGGLLWNPSAATSERTYFNWFGYNSQAMADFLSTTNTINYKNTLTSYDLRADGPVAHLPAGDIGLSVGVERYTQKSGVYQTDLNATGNIIGGSMGKSWEGDRTVNAIYAEVNVPVTKWLEAQIAGRFETYSDDGFQERVRPKIGIKARPLDWLVARASYAQSYKAPDLAYLYESEIVTFTSSQYADPAYPTDPRQQIQSKIVGNPDLKPETTDTYYIGIAVEPQKGFLKGFSGSIDFFRYNQKDLLGQFTDFYSYNSILTYALQGEEPFASMVKRAPSSGPGDAGKLLYIENPYTNISERNNQGLDFELAYMWRTQRYGDFRVSAQTTYSIFDKIDGDNIIGNYLFRRFNTTVTARWKYRDWAAYATCWYMRGTDDTWTLANTGHPDYGYLYIKYHIKDQYVFNVGLTYSGFWGTQISLGVTNLFNQRPPVDPTGTGGAVVSGVNYVLPASWALKITRKF